MSPASPFFESLLSVLFASPAISLYGFYCHAGNSYASTSLPQASSILSAEVEAVNTAAGLALAVLSGSPSYGAQDQPFVLAVGSTPTAHAASAETKARLASLLNGTLELHAGA
jgi:D-serine ammonia-lyase